MSKTLDLDEAALALWKASDGTDIVVGPALIYVDDWEVYVITSRGDPQIAAVNLGTAMAEPDPVFAALFDTVLLVRRQSDISRDEAKSCRAQLISALRQKFHNVHGFDTELEAAGCALRLWPCPLLRKLCSDLEEWRDQDQRRKHHHVH
jgi:hypothetical protein